MSGWSGHGFSASRTLAADKLDAMALAVKLQEEAGIEVVSDGEQ